MLIRCILVLSIILGACAKTRVLGVDGSAGEPDLAPATAPAPRAKRPTMIAAVAGEMLGERNPILGDVDGDGYDDFLVTTMAGLIDPKTHYAPARTYLFYGRPELPERLSTDDADAAFCAQDVPEPLGDVNGDGLADFLLLHHGSLQYEIVLGRSERFRGEIEPLSTGVVWEFAKLPPPFNSGYRTLTSFRGAGDVNCDGIDDLLVAVLKSVDGAPEPLPIARIVLGTKALPSGPWDERWVAGYLDRDGPREWPGYNEIYPYAAGDLDADGCDDLVASVSGGSIAFYGRERGWDGRATRILPDVLWEVESNDQIPIGDLDGDGAADLAAMSGDRTTLSIAYGREQRQYGQQPLSWGLTIDLEPESSGGFSVYAVDAGDIDGDGLAELVIGSAKYGLVDRWSPTPAPGALYALRGTGKRRTGRYQLQDSDLLLIGPAGLPSTESLGSSGMGAGLNVGGDVNGNGARDILTSSPSATEGGAAFVIPSPARALTPD